MVTTSLFLTGITAEQFVERPKIGPGAHDYGKSKYDLFREAIARRLGVPTGNVDVFTVMNNPKIPNTCDVRYAAHGSPYYRPARLDGIINQFKMEVGLSFFSAILSHYKYILSHAREVGSPVNPRSSGRTRRPSPLTH